MNSIRKEPPNIIVISVELSTEAIPKMNTFSCVVVVTSSESHKHSLLLRHLVFRVGFESSSPILP